MFVGRISGLIHQAVFLYCIDILSARKKKKLLDHILYVQQKDTFQVTSAFLFLLVKKKTLFSYGTGYNFSSVGKLNE